MYDPIELSKKTEKLVVKGREKKYYRFRYTRFYGGSTTADSVGCNLRCVFCWSDRAVRLPNKIGRFYNPEDVVEKLIDIADSKKCRIVRISGAEPTIGKSHLLSLLDIIDTCDKIFILETNGILLGVDRSYVEELSKYRRLHVRVSIKGCSENEFRFLTRAKSGFSYQLKAIEHLRDYRVSFHPSVVSTMGKKQKIVEKLKELGVKSSDIEWEILRIYPPVKERLIKLNLLEHFRKFSRI